MAYTKTGAGSLTNKNLATIKKRMGPGVLTETQRARLKEGMKKSSYKKSKKKTGDYNGR